MSRFVASGAADTERYIADRRFDAHGVTRLRMREYGGWVYILASKRNGTLYTGVTNELVARVAAHRDGKGSRFTAKYCVTLLVWFEFHSCIETAIQRETSIKRWRRRWKIALIEKTNPRWRDLYEELAASPALPAWLVPAKPQ